MSDPVDIKTFAAEVKRKYPDYAEVDDDQLVREVVRKYPDYRNAVRYSIGDLQGALRKAGWDEDQIVKMSAVGWHESAQGDLRANRKASATENAKITGGRGLPEDSVGPWQINWTAHGSRLEKQGIKREDLFDPVVNAQVAKQLYDESGYAPWKLASTKYAARYIPRAQQVYRRRSETPSQPSPPAQPADAMSVVANKLAEQAPINRQRRQQQQRVQQARMTFDEARQKAESGVGSVPQFKHQSARLGLLPQPPINDPTAAMARAQRRAQSTHFTPSSQTGVPIPPTEAAQAEARKNTEITRRAVRAAAPPGFEYLPKDAQEWIGSGIASVAGSFATTLAGVANDRFAVSPVTKLTNVVGRKVTGVDAGAKLMEIGNTLSQGAATMDEESKRSWYSQFPKDVLSGSISSAPAMALAALGVPAPIAFGVQGYLAAEGRGAELEETLLETGTGATIGALFELPVPKKLEILSRVGQRVGPKTAAAGRAIERATLVGTGTYGVETAVGSPHALQSAATNALFAGTGAIKHGQRLRGEEREVSRNQSPEATNAPRAATELAQAPEATAPTNRTILEAREANTISRRGAIPRQPDAARVSTTQPSASKELGVSRETQTETQSNVETQLEGAKPAEPQTRSGMAKSLEGNRVVSELVSEPAPPRHVDLQRRLDDGTFGKETKAETEERRQQVNPVQEVAPPPAQPKSQVNPVQGEAAGITAAVPEGKPILEKVDEVSYGDGRVRMVTYRTTNAEGKPLEATVQILKNGSAELDVSEGGGRGALGVRQVLALKNQLLSLHPEIKEFTFKREGSTGGEFGRERSIRVVQPKAADPLATPPPAQPETAKPEPPSGGGEGKAARSESPERTAERERIAAGTKRIGDTYISPLAPEPTAVDRFVESLPPANAQKARTALDKQMRFNGEFLTRREYVERAVRDGARVVTAKGERRLQRPDGGYLPESSLSKTAMDYAERLGTQSAAPQPPEAAAPSVKAQEYSIAKDVVDGRKVRDDVPNQSSIDATLGGTNYQELSGIREVPLADFPAPPDVNPRSKALAERIKESGEITPLIVVVEKEGPYILEGANRYDALKILGAKSFPAKVVLDESIATSQQGGPTEPATPRPTAVNRSVKSEPGGAATIRESTPPPAPKSPLKSSAREGRMPEATSIKNAATQELRADLELIELERPERISWQQSIDNALAKGLDKKAEQLAVDVISGRKPEGLTNEEAAGVQHRIRELENQWEEVYRRDSRAPELQEIKRRLGNLTRASDEGASAPARALNFRRSAINKEFSLISVVQRMEKAKGRELRDKEFERYEKVVAERDQAIKERDEALEKARVSQIQKNIDRVQRQRRRAETKETLDQEAAIIKQNIAAEFARLRSQNIQASGLAGLDPEGVITRNLVKYARNRVRANIGLKAEALLDDATALIQEFDNGITRQQVADLLSGYKMSVPEPRAEDVRRLAEIRAEIRKMRAQEDIAAGIRTERTQGPRESEARKLPAEGPPRRLFSRNQRRMKQLEKQEAEIARRLEQRDFSKLEKPEPLPYTREVARQQRRVDEIDHQFAREEYKATRSTGGKISDELAKAANVPKTIKSIGDISAVFRQGGYLAITHPVEGGLKPFRDMIRAFTDAGYRTVEQKIKDSPVYETLKKAGVEFTGIEKDNPRLSLREEGYLGAEYLDYVPVARQIKNFSERTFVSFLDAQRLYVGKQMLDGLANPGIIARTLGARRGLTRTELVENQKRIAKFINSATGRGNLGVKGNQIAPVLNIAMFSPRLLKSRVELLNNMFNPVAVARMPRNARAQVVADNVKFLAGTMAVLSLAKAAGAEVSLDPDDADFLKIRVGDTTYDTLTGLQQPLRYIINMGRAGYADITGDETYAGKTKGELTGQFARSKLSPMAGTATSYITNRDYQGREFSAKREARELVTPLIAKDFYEAIKQEGLIGIAKAAPALTGIGVASYPKPPEKATTQAEKLARKFIRDKIPNEARSDEEIERSKTISDLRIRSRRGEDVSKELDALPITLQQKRRIVDAKELTRLQEDIRKLALDDALTVWEVASDEEKASVKELILNKAVNSLRLRSTNDQEAIKARMKSLGLL